MVKSSRWGNFVNQAPDNWKTVTNSLDNQRPSVDDNHMLNDKRRVSLRLLYIGLRVRAERGRVWNFEAVRRP